MQLILLIKGFPGDSVVKNLSASAGDTGSILSWEDPLEKQPTPVLLPGKYNGEKSYSQWDGKRVGHDSATKQSLYD